MKCSLFLLARSFSVLGQTQHERPIFSSCFEAFFLTMVMKVAVLLHSMVALCIFTQTINANNSNNGASTSANNTTTSPSSTKNISPTPSASDLSTVTSTSRSQSISNTPVEIQTTSTTSSPNTTALSTAKTTSDTTTPKLTSSPSIDATPNAHLTTSFKMTETIAQETSQSTVGKTTASSSSDNRTATITSVATNGTLSSSSRSSTHGQTSSAATSFVGSPSTTVVMPTVNPNWTNWRNKGKCKDICCGIGGTITQIRSCTKGSITLTSPNPCDGNSTKTVTCDKGCPQCSSGLMLMTERLVAVGCVVLGLVIKLLYAG